MITINPRTFAALCYLTLMEHHGSGIKEAHPAYIEEKLYLLQEGYNAFLALDSLNQGLVLGHLSKWGYEPPQEIKDYVNEAYKARYF